MQLPLITVVTVVYNNYDKIENTILSVLSQRDYYDRMVGCVMTNQYFTQPAVDAAKKLKILLWDKDYIDSMLYGE